MAVYDNLVTYFNRTVKPYNPYKGNKTFQAISTLLRDSFLKDSYQDIPTTLSKYVNDQKVSIDLYTKLLMGNGYPEDIVKTITTNDKEDILNGLMHYQDESGTLNHFIDIAKTFNEKFNLYELYADYRWFNKNGRYVFDWVLAGNPIYTVNDEPCDIYEYQDVYNKTPTLFLSRNTLEYWRLSKGIVLPFKTNLMVVSQQDVTTVNLLDLIIAMTAYSEFQYEKLNTEYNGVLYSFNLGALFQIWNYCLSYADDQYISEIPTFRGNAFPLEGRPPYVLNPEAPNSIQHLVALYNNIVDKDTSDQFWSEVTSNYSTYLSGSVSISDLRSKLTPMVSLEFISNLENIIDSGMTRMDGLCQALTILESILDSFIENATDPLVGMYEKWFRLLMTKPNGAITNSTTYKLLYEFKPYHTRFILETKFKLKYDDRAENTYSKDKVYFVHHIWHASAAVLSDSYTVYKTYYGKYYMENNSQIISQSCKDFHGINIGDMVTFVMAANPDGEYPALQVIDIQTDNITVTESQFNELKYLFTEKSKYRELIESLEPQILYQSDEDAINSIKDINEVHEILFHGIEETLRNPGPIEIYTDDSTYNSFIAFEIERYLEDCAETIKREFNQLQHQNHTLYKISKLFDIYEFVRDIYPILEQIKDDIEQITKFEERQSDGTILIKTQDKLKVADVYDIIINSDLPNSYKKLLSIPFVKDNAILEVDDDVLFMVIDKYKDPTLSLGFDIYNFLDSFENIYLIFTDISIAFNNSPTSYIIAEYIDNLIDSYIAPLSEPNKSKTQELINTIYNIPIQTSEYNISNFDSFSICDTKLIKEIHSVYNTNELDLTYRLTKQAILLDYSELSKIEHVLSTDDICTLIFDNGWEGPTGWYDQIKISTLPPVQDIVEPEGAQFTFTNIELAQYVHCNDIGFKSIYIGDYIYVFEDDIKYAVKVIGKDLDLRNLKLEKTYLGTAGTFSRVGRYRTGF